MQNKDEKLLNEEISIKIKVGFFSQKEQKKG
jgi:hypothetical protein